MGPFFSIQYDPLVLNFRLSKSFLNILIIKPIGVTTKKKISPIISGDIILPSNIPNLDQSLLSGVKIFEFDRPNNKKITDITRDHILISPSFFNGKIAIIKNTIKKNYSKTSVRTHNFQIFKLI